MSGEAIYFFGIICLETFYFWAMYAEVHRIKREIKEKIDTLMSDVWVWTRDERRTDDQ